MIKALTVGQTIVCTIEGKMYQKSFDTDTEALELYQQIANTDEDNLDELDALKQLFTPPLTQQEQEDKAEFERQKENKEAQKELLEWMEDIKNLGDEHFEVKGIKLYMKGVGITIPEQLAREFASRRDNEQDLDSLMNFWRLLSLNPDPRAREDLFKFLDRNGMVVTPSGYFLAYRNANRKNGGDNVLYEFLSAQYTKVKGWKKSPKNYIVLQDNEDGSYLIKADGLFSKWFNKVDEEQFNTVGNLDDLYVDIVLDGKGDIPIYTDAHSRTTTIIIGEPTSIPRNECDANPDRDCSRGLHLGNKEFMRAGSFGSVGLVCLCNPMHVVAVPYTNGQKLRTCEYLPIGVAEYDENRNIIPIESATFEYDYAEHTEEQLEEMLSAASFEELKEHKIIPLELEYEDFQEMVEAYSTSMHEMKEAIRKRVVNV